MTKQELFHRFSTSDLLDASLSDVQKVSGRHYLISGQVQCWDGPGRDLISPILVRNENSLDEISLGQGAMLTRRQALEALESAVAAYDDGAGNWPQTTITKRAGHVATFIETLKEKRALIANLLMWEIGKTLPDSLNEFDRTVEYLENTLATLHSNLEKTGALIDLPNADAMIRRAPLGVVLVMGPYNVPLFETLCLALPAALMGNTVVIKAPRIGALCLQPLLKAFASCFPPGVINYIDGDGQKIITPMMETGHVAVLAFVGSFRVANIVMRAHPKPNRLKSVLGLDAKNPAVICKNADLDLAVANCVKGALGFNGQRCTGLKMLFVHKSVETEFLDRFSKAVDRLKIGMPWEDDISITPLAEPEKPAWLGKLVEDALEKGARIHNHGGAHCKTLYKPAVLSPVNREMEIAHVEQFGPVTPVASFTDVEEVRDYIRQSDYGQQISLFCNSSEKLGRMIDLFAPHVCRLNINTYSSRNPDVLPFTGRKDSAHGTVSLTESLQTFSKSAVVFTPDSQKDLLKEMIIDGHSKLLEKK